MENESNPVVKYSQCQTCKGYIRCAILSEMTDDSMSEFNTEVFELNLLVNQTSLAEFNKIKMPFCGC